MVKETLRGRFQGYIQENFFGGTSMTQQFKRWALVDVMSAGFKIEARCVSASIWASLNFMCGKQPQCVFVFVFVQPTLHRRRHTLHISCRFWTDAAHASVLAKESQLLYDFNFALNDGPTEQRWPIIVSDSEKRNKTKPILQWPVIDKNSGTSADDFQRADPFGLGAYVQSVVKGCVLQLRKCTLPKLLMPHTPPVSPLVTQSRHPEENCRDFSC